jgi:hypothetical protein
VIKTFKQIADKINYTSKKKLPVSIKRGEPYLQGYEVSKKV